MKATTLPVNRVLAALGVAPTGAAQYSARCPVHDDNNASLSIGAEVDGTVGLHCHAGREPAAVCAALGLSLARAFGVDMSVNPDTLGLDALPVRVVSAAVAADSANTAISSAPSAVKSARSAAAVANFTSRSARAVALVASRHDCRRSSMVTSSSDTPIG